MSTPQSSTNEGWQGMNWIRQDKRLAIYLRDGLACVWCGFSLEEGAKLSLDHIVCRSAGGSNHENNLVTSCCKCNSSRGKRTIEEFAQAAATYVGRDASEILEHVAACTAKALKPFRAEAKEIIARRIADKNA